ncbi:MAG: protein kinase [Thermoanaerobaculia bacterium]|nr:protein kinase [Thermoanaerobaculia bacterium]
MLANHRVLGKKVAIKALAPQYLHHRQLRERFLKEGQALAKLTHRNIVEIHDFIDDSTGVYMIMEYMPGGSLKDAIERAGGPLPVPWVVARVKEALGGLDYAHRHLVIHRDVKPSNILLDVHETAKVADFGIALLFGEQRITTTGSTLGTPHYMSPEQITRPKEVTHLTDVYAMGVVLYELLTGQTPFDGDSDFTIQAAHVKEPPRRPRQLNGALPDALEAVVLRALEKRPEDRFGGCADMLQSLDAALTPGAFLSPPPVRPASTIPTQIIQSPPSWPPPPSPYSTVATPPPPPVTAQIPPTIGSGIPIQKVPTYLGRSILVTLFCCLPLGIPAIVYASQVNAKLLAGDVQGALRSSQKAKSWSTLAMVISLGFGLIYVFGILGEL